MGHEIGRGTEGCIVVRPEIIHKARGRSPGTHVHKVAAHKAPIIFCFIRSTCPWTAFMRAADKALVRFIPYIGINICQKLVNGVFMSKHLLYSSTVLRHLV